MLTLPGWIAKDKQTNALATATKAAQIGKSHYITAVSGSYSAAAAGKLLQVKDGATVIAEFHVHNSFSHTFPKPIWITAGAACSAELAASGTAGVDGAVTLSGITD